MNHLTRKEHTRSNLMYQGEINGNGEYYEFSPCEVFVDFVDTSGGNDGTERSDEFYFGPTVYPVPREERPLGFDPDITLPRPNPNILD